MVAAGSVDSQVPARDRPPGILGPRPGSVVARWLSRLQSAAYVGMSPATFDRRRQREVDPIPPPILVGPRLALWDRHELDAWVRRQREPGGVAASAPGRLPLVPPRRQTRWR